MNKGEDKEFKLALPEDYAQSELAGKDVILLGNPGPTLGIAAGTVVLQLPEMKPGDVSPVIGPFDAVAPDAEGHYVIDFKLEGGFCFPYVAFDVVR